MAREDGSRDAADVLTGSTSARPGSSEDVATALEQARTLLGQRPAITVHHASTTASDPGGDRRLEQGFASLAGWVAKGAHLIRDELGLGPGDELGLAAPASWPVATVALAAWWVGVTLVPAAAAEVAVVHTANRGEVGDGATLLWLGDATDGAGPHDTRRPPGEWWTEAVIPFPDRPPTPSRDGELVAVRAGGTSSTQRDLLDRFTGARGVLGLRRNTSHPTTLDVEQLAQLVLRPLVTGSATVVLVDVTGEPEEVGSPLARIVSQERIMSWGSPGHGPPTERSLRS